MLFSTQGFLLGFLPASLLAYYLAPNRIGRQLVVICASLLFYGFWDWRFVPLLVGLALVNWGCGVAFAASGSRIWPIGGIVLDLAILGVCKYADFGAASLDALLGQKHTPWAIILPLGLSFFVFQKISYLADLLRGVAGAYRCLDFMEFVIFFPQLIAGPIVRHNEIIPQFARDPRKPEFRPELWENLSRGGVLLVIGLAKKAGLADTLATICDPLFDRAASGDALSAAEAWLATLSYSLQIFFDFSGYSDMAIGMALLFGLRLPFNFNSPYRATSIRDFWQRWHMTLSRFLRDYLYIPLGGNRRGRMRQALNLMLTMSLAGLWHGAGWNFVAWGGAHGAALVVQHEWTHRRRAAMPAMLGWALTLGFVAGTWVLFRAPSFTTTAHLYAAMVGAHGLGHAPVHHAAVFWLAMALALLGPSSQKMALEIMRPSTLLAIPAGMAFVFFLLLIGGRIPDPFIYFQF